MIGFMGARRTLGLANRTRLVAQANLPSDEHIPRFSRRRDRDGTGARMSSFLCIGCTDLLTELQFHSHDRLKLSLALLAGIGIVVVIAQFGHVEHA